MIKKLEIFGFHSTLISSIHTYLIDRTQYVKINDNLSHSFKVNSGVPQGSHLGPLLFLIFINDITNELKYSRCLLYADDLKIFLPVASIEDHEQLQADLNCISDWCNRNCLYLNVSKCKCMTFHRKRIPLLFDYSISGTLLLRVTEVQDLGR